MFKAEGVPPRASVVNEMAAGTTNRVASTPAGQDRAVWSNSAAQQAVAKAAYESCKKRLWQSAKHPAHSTHRLLHWRGQAGETLA